MSRHREVYGHEGRIAHFICGQADRQPESCREFGCRCLVPEGARQHSADTPTPPPPKKYTVSWTLNEYDAPITSTSKFDFLRNACGSGIWNDVSANLNKLFVSDSQLLKPHAPHLLKTSGTSKLRTTFQNRFRAPAFCSYRWKYLSFTLGALLTLVLSFVPGVVDAQSLEDLIERIDRLEEENRQLRNDIEALKAKQAIEHTENAPSAVTAPESESARFLGVDPEFGFTILDPTTAFNRKQRLILNRRKDGTLDRDNMYVHGAVTAVANYQTSNRADKFGYLMRHPTASNQVGKEVSEAAIHSVQLGFTATLSDWITAHAAMLFDPEQSFGKGTNTDLERNQIQVREAYVLLGNLDRSPFFTSLGKMTVPFGLTDTVNPFTASTVWHAFGGLANGLTVGYTSKEVNLTAMAIQGGSQFRATNTPVKGTNVPSRLNNFALDANRTFRLGQHETLLVGGSYLHGSAYCQDFPVMHFMPCRDNNPAFDIYGKLEVGDFTFKSEFARTTDEWPGTFNPGIPEFAASDVTAFDIGMKYRINHDLGPVDLSAEFSRFEAGPKGAPWERQNQVVLGAAWFPQPSVKLFTEFIRVDGFAPLNFISGGSVKDENDQVIPNRTISDSTARSNIFLLGVNAAF